MTTPNRLPLWRYMEAARHDRQLSDDHVSAEANGPAYAAEIRAVADWIKERQVGDYGVTLPDVREIIGWLTAEADRAEGGVK